MDIKEPLYREHYKTNDDDNHHVHTNAIRNRGVVAFPHDGSVLILQ